MSDRSHPKRPPSEFRFHRQATDHRRCQLVGERHILELISVGAALPGILNKLCMMIDVRIGNVVSIISLPDADEKQFCTMTRSALQVGLEVFSSSPILSSEMDFLGILEIYGCDARRPTLLEYHLIDRVSHLAAVALQRPEPAERDDSFPTEPNGKLRGHLEKPPYIN